MGNRFDNNKSKKGINPIVVSLLIFAVILCLFVMASNSIFKSSFYDDKRMLEDAISRDIVHCYAIEGAYPPSISYMEEHYGLSVDYKRFIVDYDLQGDNILPTYMVIERSE